MSFFTKDFLEFFRELEQNNNRDWFHGNKKRYDASVKKPFNNFVEEMISRIHAVDPEVAIPAKDAIFRINRDIRFSKDKSPYKTHMAAVISREGRRNHAEPGLYFHLGADKVYLGGGAYQLDKQPLYNVRKTIAENTDEFQKLIEDKQFKKKFGGIKGEQNKVLPKEFKEAAETQPLIYNKQFYYMAELSPNVVVKKDLADRFMDYYLASRNMAEFLKSAMQD